MLVETTKVTEENPDQGLVEPDLEHRVLAAPQAVTSYVLTGLFLMALFHTLRVARDLFLPLTLAFLLTFLLRPVVRALKRFRVPEALGAALVLLGLLGAVGLGLYGLTGPAAEWMAKAPASVSRVQGRLRPLRRPMEQMSRTADQMEKTIAGQTSAPTPVEVKQPGLKEAVFGGTWAFLSGTIVVVVLLYFLLASGDLFLRKLINVLPCDHVEGLTIIGEFFGPKEGSWPPHPRPPGPARATLASPRGASTSDRSPRPTRRASRTPGASSKPDSSTARAVRWRKPTSSWAR